MNEKSIKNNEQAKRYEITTCFSIELSKKQDNITDISSRQNVKSKLGDKNYKETMTPPDDENVIDNVTKKKILRNSLKKKFKDCLQIDEEEKFNLNNSTNDHNADKKSPRKDSIINIPIKNKKFSDERRSFYADNTLLNIVSDLKTLGKLKN